MRLGVMQLASQKCEPGNEARGDAMSEPEV